MGYNEDREKFGEKEMLKMKRLVLALTLISVMLFASCGAKDEWKLDDDMLFDKTTEQFDDSAYFEYAKGLVGGGLSEEYLEENDNSKYQISNRVCYSPYSAVDSAAAPRTVKYFLFVDGAPYSVVTVTEIDGEILGTQDGAIYDDKGLIADAVKNGTPFAICSIMGSDDGSTTECEAIYFITEDGYELMYGSEVDDPEQYFERLYMNEITLNDVK